LTHVLVLAVKPQVIYEVMAEIQPIVGSYTLVLSIAAGISLVGLSEGLQTERVIRTMPNTPAQVGRGITGAVGLSITEEDRETANALLSAAGQVMWFDDESKIDGVTAVSGSGPAYVFYMVEALAAAARRQGFDDGGNAAGAGDRYRRRGADGCRSVAGRHAARERHLAQGHHLRGAAGADGARWARAAARPGGARGAAALGRTRAGLKVGAG
jgi:hypothetical protein